MCIFARPIVDLVTEFKYLRILHARDHVLQLVAEIEMKSVPPLRVFCGRSDEPLEAIQRTSQPQSVLPQMVATPSQGLLVRDLWHFGIL